MYFSGSSVSSPHKSVTFSATRSRNLGKDLGKEEKCRAFKNAYG